MFREAESHALGRELDDWEEWISCSIARTEVLRACRLADSRQAHSPDDRLAVKGEEVLNRIALDRRRLVAAASGLAG